MGSCAGWPDGSETRPGADSGEVRAGSAARRRRHRVLCGWVAGDGDFRPGISDLDLRRSSISPVDEEHREQLRELHETVQRDEPSAAKLHCVYLPTDDLTDLSSAHLTWAHGELYRRRFTGIARAS